MISIICPCHNEADVIDEFVARLTAALGEHAADCELICVNDGSGDETLARLLAQKDGPLRLRILDLSRQFGKEAALSAGLDHAEGDAVIMIDADLQDPPEIVPDMIAAWKNGAPVVLARRIDRSADTWLKRTVARAYYWVHNVIADPQIPVDTGDFRLLDREVVEVMKQLPERQRFMKGLFAWVGFEAQTVDYTREARGGGKSKFNWWRLWNFGLEGITSFSTAPLRVWTYVGSFVSIVALAYGAYIVIRTLIYGIDVPGYASLFTAILFLGGIQLISLGVIGEYVGRIYMETKSRPLYVVRREL